MRLVKLLMLFSFGLFEPEFRLIPEEAPMDELLELEFELFSRLLMALLELDDELDEPELELDTACPLTRPCKISAKFFALAYFSRKTFNPPKRSAGGTSSISMVCRMRFRDCISPLIMMRLVRLSAMMRTREPFKSFEAPVEVMASNRPIISSA